MLPKIKRQKRHERTSHFLKMPKMFPSPSYFSLNYKQKSFTDSTNHFKETKFPITLLLFYHADVNLKGQFHGFAHVQALALAVVNFTVSY